MHTSPFTRIISHIKLACLVTLMLVTTQVSAQTIYPIRTISTISGVTPTSLDKFVSEEGKFQTQIITDDVTMSHYAVKLRLTLQSADVRITTLPSYLPAPIYLEGGSMDIFTATDLADLFSVNNLAFEGVTKAQYQKTNRLPEGVYRVWVDVLDYYHNVVISKSTAAIGMMYLTKPPQLTFPASGSEIDIATTPQIRFSWMTFHPINPAAEISHRFRLWEIQPAGRNPYEIVNAIKPIYQEDVTTGASLLLNPDNPLLLQGRTYAWQVQGIDAQNQVIYQNDGKSQVFTFRYGKSCVTPAPRIVKIGTTDAQIAWDGNTNTQQYKINYKTATATEWTSSLTNLAYYTVPSITDNTNYQITVTAICGSEQSDESRPLLFRTNRTVNYACGPGAMQFDLSNKTPLPTLIKWEEFKAADFIIEADKVTGGNGTFSGTGLALVPYLGFAKMMVTFNNITINSDHRMIAGEIKFVYDVATGMVIGIPTKGGSQDDDFTDNLSKSVTQVVTTTKEVKTVTVKENTVTITLADGTTQTITVAKKGNTVGIITPSKTTAFVADTGSGNVYTTPLPSKSEASSSSSVATASQTGKYGCTVTITPSATQRFGFDAVGNGKIKPDSYFLKNKSGQSVAWKSIEAGATDYVDVAVKGASIDSLRYLRESGITTPSSRTNKGSQLLLMGSGQGDEELLTVALSTKKTAKDSTVTQTLTEAGAVGLVSYEALTREVILVPVNDAVAPTTNAEIQTTLIKIFAPAIVSWKVTIEPKITVPAITPDGFSATGLSTLSRYTTDMNKVVDAYKASHNISRNTLVLFFVRATNADKAGYMPLTGDYGFIFNLGSNTELLAHELSHGAFNLRHTFTNKPYWRLSGKPPVYAQNSTLNLMDYAGGSELWKYQWDLIHDKEFVLMGSLNEAEGAYNTDGHYYTVQLVALMMGMSPTDAIKLGVEAENPDNVIKDVWNLEERYTHLKPGLQQQYHVLTGRKHGIELALTSYAFLFSHNDEGNNSFKYLLHRFGDCFGHINTNNTSFSLQADLFAYTSAVEDLLNQDVVPKIKTVSGDLKILVDVVSTNTSYIPIEKTMQSLKIYYDGTNLLTVLDLNETKKELIQQLLYSYSEQDNLHYSHNKYLRSELIEKLDKRLPKLAQNDYDMFGNDYFGGTGHVFYNLFDSTNPDFIRNRKDLYRYYVDRLIDLLQKRYGIISFSKTEINENMSRIIEFATTGILKNNNKLQVIFAFECALHSNAGASELNFFLPKDTSDDEWNSLSDYIKTAYPNMAVIDIYRFNGFGFVFFKK